MDENLITLLDELSLRSACSEDETGQTRDGGSNCASSSGVSSPVYEQISNSIAEENSEFKNAVCSLLHDLKPNPSSDPKDPSQSEDNCDKSKLILALLGNIELVTTAVKKINRLVLLGKRMEQIYRCYYRDPNVPLDLNEISHLITQFSEIYESESYVREVNACRVYKAFHGKMILIYNSRKSSMDTEMVPSCEDEMIT